MRKLRTIIGLSICLTLALIMPPKASVSLANNDDDDDWGTIRFCPQQFEATVHQGPNAEKLSIQGTISLERTGSKGQVDGHILAANGGSFPVHGQIYGRAANIMIDLGNDAHVFGTGTVLRKNIPRDNCVVFGGGGTFAGPQPSDIGTWSYGYCITSFFCNNTPPPTNDCSTDHIKQYSFQNGQFIFAAGGSCVTVGADTLSVVDPSTHLLYGPFPVKFDSTGTQIVGIYDPHSVQPVGTCRNFFMTNTSGARSNTVTLCR
jgi:hypothetical protein